MPPCILKLNISYNKITIKGAEAISECLKTNGTLTELDLSWNEVTNDGAVNIAKAVQVNVGLQKLDISHNKISTPTIPDLGICFKWNNILQKLIISWNDTKTTFVYTTTDECYVDVILYATVTLKCLCVIMTYCPAGHDQNTI